MNDLAHPATALKALQASDPTQPAGAFYIQSSIGSTDWVLARRNINGREVVRLAHKSGALDQLWTREDDPRGGYFLTNLETNTVLTWHGRGIECTLEAKNLGDPHQLWVTAGGQWAYICAPNWNQTLNVFGYSYGEGNGIGLWEISGGQPNELWMYVAERGEVKVESITYDMNAARLNLGLAPTQCLATAVDNRMGAIVLDTNVELQRVVSNSRQLTYSDSSAKTIKIAQTLGYKLGIEKIVEVSNQMAMETSTTSTITFGDQKVQTTSNADKVTVRVQVPPKSVCEYAVRVYYGSVTVPYTAQVSRTLPNGSKEYTNIVGTYTNVNMIKYDIQANDVTSGTPKPLQAIAPAAAEREPAHA